jgi:hypothetical protein
MVSQMKPFESFTHSTPSSNRAIELSMLSRLAISIALAVALIVAPTYASPRTCIVTDAPAQKACKPGCCANKACCATSKKVSGPIAQPLTKSASGSELSAICVATVAAAPISTSLDRQFVFWRAAWCALVQPQLAVLCTFLI